MPANLSESETTAVTAVGVTFSTISLIGSLVIIASYLKFREVHPLVLVLVLCVMCYVLYELCVTGVMCVMFHSCTRHRSL